MSFFSCLRPLLLLGLCAIAPSGCGLAGEEEPARRGQEPPAAQKANEPPDEARSIRGWSAALNRGDFGRAASFFASNAVVEQQVEVRLPDRAAAIAFNRSLPCRADVTDVEKTGSTVVAAFQLREGRFPGRGCSGAARVRFRFKGDKFTEWRQLPEPAAPGGVIA